MEYKAKEYKVASVSKTEAKDGDTKKLVLVLEDAYELVNANKVFIKDATVQLRKF